MKASIIPARQKSVDERLAEFGGLWTQDGIVLTKIVADDPKFIPEYKTTGAACVDLIANLPNGSLSIPYRTLVEVDCGFSMQLPKGFRASITMRSGLGKHGLTIPNSPGIIDSDYRGRVIVLIGNIGKEIVVINHGDRFAQMSIEPIHVFDFIETDKLDETERGDGAFGSTGV